MLRAFVQVSDVLSALGSRPAVDRGPDAGPPRLAEASANDAQTAYRLGGGTLMRGGRRPAQLSRARRALAEAQAQRFSDLVQLYAATAADWRTA